MFLLLGTRDLFFDCAPSLFMFVFCVPFCLSSLSVCRLSACLSLSYGLSCVCVCLFVYMPGLSVCAACLVLFTYCLSVLCGCLFCRLSYLYVCLSCLSIARSVCFVCLSVCVAVFLSFCLSIGTSVAGCRSVCVLYVLFALRVFLCVWFMCFVHWGYLSFRPPALFTQTCLPLVCLPQTGWLGKYTRYSVHIFLNSCGFLY